MGKVNDGFNELEYRKMILVFACERELRRMDDDFRKIAKEYRESRKRKVDDMIYIKNEIESGIFQPELFDKENNG